MLTQQRAEHEFDYDFNGDWLEIWLRCGPRGARDFKFESDGHRRASPAVIRRFRGRAVLRRGREWTARLDILTLRGMYVLDEVHLHSVIENLIVCVCIYTELTEQRPWRG